MPTLTYFVSYFHLKNVQKTNFNNYNQFCDTLTLIIKVNTRKKRPMIKLGGNNIFSVFSFARYFNF